MVRKILFLSSFLIFLDSTFAKTTQGCFDIIHQYLKNSFPNNFTLEETLFLDMETFQKFPEDNALLGAVKVKYLKYEQEINLLQCLKNEKLDFLDNLFVAGIKSLHNRIRQIKYSSIFFKAFKNNVFLTDSLNERFNSLKNAQDKIQKLEMDRTINITRLLYFITGRNLISSDMEIINFLENLSIKYKFATDSGKNIVFFQNLIKKLLIDQYENGEILEVEFLKMLKKDLRETTQEVIVRIDNLTNKNHLEKEINNQIIKINSNIFNTRTLENNILTNITPNKNMAHKIRSVREAVASIEKERRLRPPLPPKPKINIPSSGDLCYPVNLPGKERVEGKILLCNMEGYDGLPVKPGYKISPKPLARHLSLPERKKVVPNFNCDTLFTTERNSLGRSFLTAITSDKKLSPQKNISISEVENEFNKIRGTLNHSQEEYIAQMLKRVNVQIRENLNAINRKRPPENVTGYLAHENSISKEAISYLVKALPKLLLECYQLAKESNDLMNFWNNAFNNSLACLEGRMTTLSEFKLNNSQEIDFETVVNYEKNMEPNKLLFEYLNVFKILKLRDLYRKSPLTQNKNLFKGKEWDEFYKKVAPELLIRKQEFKDYLLSSGEIFTQEVTDWSKIPPRTMKFDPELLEKELNDAVELFILEE